MGAQAAAVQTASDAVEDAGLVLDAVVHEPGESLSQEDWLAVVRRCQMVVNRLEAVQDVAVAAAARFESVWDEDGTLGSVEHGPGRVALDAADLVAPELGVSHHQAQARVEAAVRRTGLEPVPVEVAERPRSTGLGALHQAMRAGRLDAHRAGAVAFELADVPAAVAEAVLAALEPHLEREPAAALRRRTRRILGRISPDLLRQRAQRARRETGLRRWVAEPGVDAWYGTFPSEQSAAAWTTIDRLARQYVTDGTCSSIEQARGRALTDLVVQHVDLRFRVVLTTPADTTSPSVPAGAASEPAARLADGSADDLVQVHGIRPSEPTLVERGWLQRVLASEGTDVVTRPCHPASGALLDASGSLARDAYRPTEALVLLVKARDGRCRFPGCSVAARFCDVDHVRPWPAGPTAATNLFCLCRRHHRIKQSPGWWVRLRPDGTAEWTDPRGRVRVTQPLDALEQVVLAAEPDDPAATGRADASGSRAELPSVLDEACERRLEQHEVTRRRRCALAAREDSSRRHRARAPDPGAPPF